MFTTYYVYLECRHEGQLTSEDPERSFLSLRFPVRRGRTIDVAFDGSAKGSFYYQIYDYSHCTEPLFNPENIIQQATNWQDFGGRALFRATRNGFAEFRFKIFRNDIVDAHYTIEFLKVMAHPSHGTCPIPIIVTIHGSAGPPPSYTADPEKLAIGSHQLANSVQWDNRVEPSERVYITPGKPDGSGLWNWADYFVDLPEGSLPQHSNQLEVPANGSATVTWKGEIQGPSDSHRHDLSYQIQTHAGEHPIDIDPEVTVDEC